MDFTSQFTKIETDDSLMELATHGSKDYPFHYYYENLAIFDFNCINWHWHSELEFVYIESGQVAFDIGEAHFELSEGQAIMINSKILHRLQSKNDAIIPNFLFQPSFIAPENSLIYKKYVSPLLSSSLEYITFCDDIPWQSEALVLIRKIITSQNTDLNQEITVSMYVQMLWKSLVSNISFEQTDNKGAILSRTRLQMMMNYIHTHYTENVTLEDIASIASISKSSALHLFQDSIQMTPVNYLITYRLRQASHLLVNTEKKITSISTEVGFNNVDHFCRSFKKAYGITPSTYRRQSNYSI